MADATTMTRRQAPRPDEPEHENEKKTFLGLSLTQISGSAVAAMTSAVAASFFGVTGTLIGAAFGSVVSTVAGAAYARSLQTAAGRLRTTRTVVVRPGPDGVRGTSQHDPARIPSGVGAAQVPTTEVPPAGGPTHSTATSTATTYRATRRLRWKPIAAVAALGFVLGMGLLSLTEGLLGHPVSDAGTTGTTIGEVVGGGGSSGPEPASTPSGASTGTATSTSTATPEDRATVSPDAGTTASPDATGTASGGATTAPSPDASTTTSSTSPVGAATGGATPAP